MELVSSARCSLRGQRSRSLGRAGEGKVRGGKAWFGALEFKKRVAFPPRHPSPFVPFPWQARAKRSYTQTVGGAVITRYVAIPGSPGDQLEWAAVPPLETVVAWWWRAFFPVSRVAPAAPWTFPPSVVVTDRGMDPRRTSNILFIVAF